MIRFLTLWKNSPACHEVLCNNFNQQLTNSIELPFEHHIFADAPTTEELFGGTNMIHKFFLKIIAASLCFCSKKLIFRQRFLFQRWIDKIRIREQCSSFEDLVPYVYYVDAVHHVKIVNINESMSILADVTTKYR